MEHAGQAVAEYIKETFPKARSILVLCGPGNNGGDGIVAARHLAERYKVSVVLLSTHQSSLAEEGIHQLPRSVAVLSGVDAAVAHLEKSDVIVDAMLGIGGTGELREPYRSVVSALITKRHPAVVSVDVPTGLGTDSALVPTATVTFHDRKEGMTEANSGHIHVVDIGIPAEASTYVGPGDLNTSYPRPRSTSHKGENGVVLVLGGGPYTGAPALSGLAALRTGADLVFIATPRRSWQAIASYSPNLIVKDLGTDYLVSSDLSLLDDILSRTDAILIGPGLGREPQTEAAVFDFIEAFLRKKVPLVVDADAIAALGKCGTMLANSPTVVTPHVGEFTKLTGERLPDDLAGRVGMVTAWAKKLGITICLKGPTDIISDGASTKLNQVHNVGMSVGGTGDVLAGIIVALMSKGVAPFDAACSAAFLNGAAGNEVFSTRSYGLLATDVIEAIPTVLRRTLTSRP